MSATVARAVGNAGSQLGVLPSKRRFLPYLGILARTLFPLLLADLVAVMAAILVGHAMGLLLGVSLLGRTTLVSVIPCVWVVCLTFWGAYPSAGSNPAAEFRSVGTATMLASLLLAVVCLLTYPRGSTVALLILFGVGIPCLLIGFALRQCVRQWLAGRSWWGIRVLIIGNDESSHRVFERLAGRPWRGMKPVGFVACPQSLWERPGSKLDDDYLGPVGELRQIAERERCYHAIVMLTERLNFTPEIYRDVADVFPHVMIASPTGAFPSLWTENREIGGMPCMDTKVRLMMPPFMLCKRVIDFALVLISSPVLLPLLAILAALVRLTSEGPILYGQERLGQGGQLFRAWKFRTMRQNADQILESYLQSDPELQREWEQNHKLREDPRVTSIGRFPPYLQPGRTPPALECSRRRNESRWSPTDCPSRSCQILPGILAVPTGQTWLDGTMAGIRPQQYNLRRTSGSGLLLHSKLVDLVRSLYSPPVDQNHPASGRCLLMGPILHCPIPTSRVH